MSASYPGSGVKSFTTKVDGAGQTIFASYVNDVQDELVAVEGGLLNGVAHALKPSSDGAQDLGTAGLRWGIARAKGLQLTDATTLTLATDAITVTQSYHAIDTEGAAATDNCATITAGTGVAAGFVLILRAANVAHVVTLKDGTGNLLLNGDCALSATDTTLTLIYDGTNWREVARTSSTALTLLKSGNGTDTNAAAATVDSVAISGLTANDILRIEIYCESVAQQTSNPGLYHVTDAADLILFTNAVIAAGAGIEGQVLLHQRQGTATGQVANSQGAIMSGAAYVNAAFKTTTTAWTGSWTLGLRHQGVTAGGTFKWHWSVYRMAGQ